MAFKKQIHPLYRFYSRMNKVEKVLLWFTSLCLIRPLTLPNWYRFGWVEVKPAYLEDCPFRDVSFSDIQNNASDYGIEPGGRYTNSHCKHVQEVAIVVPYRNRSEHLASFLSHLHPFLVSQNRANYQIFIVEQDDALPFNRGRLLNIGFVEALGLNPSIECFVFHDVDIIPSSVRQLYQCSSVPRHLCAYLDKFRYVLIYPTIFGGAISLRTDHFRLTNGYSNLFSGWGGEDDDFYNRVRQHFPHIERFDSTVGRCTMFSHHQYDPNPSRSSLLQNGAERIATDGLASLEQSYQLVSIEKLALFAKIKVKLK